MSDSERFQRLEQEFHRLSRLSVEERDSELEALAELDAELAAELQTMLGLPSGVATREDALDELAAATRHFSRHRGDREQPEIEGFDLVRVLGEGGMGRVWEAEQLGPVRRRVALKVLHRGLDSERIVARFDAERQALAVMSHPNIARVYAAGTSTDGRPWFAMELVDGVPIDRFADRRGLGLEKRLELLLPVCAAIQHAHSKGLVHRDLKPSNLLVTEIDGFATPKVVDFGIAKSIEQPLLARSSATRFGELVGTPEYMSPEQAALGSIDVDTRSDVYGLGLVLYELLVGELPIPIAELRGNAFDELCRRIREDPTPRPSERLRTRSRAGVDTPTPTASLRRVEGDLDRVVLKALAKDRDQRYGSPAELAADLDRFLRNEPVTATAPSWSYRTRKFVRRHVVAVAATGLVALALIAGTTAATIGLLRARAAEQEAVLAEGRASDALATSKATTEFLLALFRAADPREQPGAEVSARDLLDRGAERIDSLGSPTVQAALLEALGEASWALGAFDRAQSLLDRAITLRSQGLAADALRLAADLDRLGGIERDRGDLEEAEATYRRALEVLGEIDALESEDAGRTLNNLAIVLRRRNEVDEAAAVYEQVIELTKRLEPQPTRNLASAYANLAALLQFRGESERSLAANLDALRLLEEILPENHPDLSTLHTNIAFAAKSLGDVGGAIVHASTAVAIDRVSIPPTHPNLALDLNALGGAQLRLGLVGEARATFEEAFAILNPLQGPPPFIASLPRGGLGTTALLGGDARQAREMLADVASDLSSSDHPQAPRHRIAWLHQLAIAERRLGRPQAAAAAADEAVALSRGLDRRNDTARGLLLRALAAHDAADPDASDWWVTALAEAECSDHAACDIDRPDALVTRAQWWALSGDSARAMAALQWGIEGPGWSATMLDEPDLAGLGGSPHWSDLEARLSKRLAEATAIAATAPSTALRRAPNASASAR